MNTKMKVLSLALLGLGGFGFAGSALAVCPAGPDIANGGAWTAVTQFQGTATIGTPGLDGTECDLNSVVNAGASGAAAAVVEDDSPTNEPRYRVQYTIDLDALASPTVTTGVITSNFLSATTGTGLQVGIFGSGGVWFVSAIVPTAGGGVYTTAIALAAGENRVEFDYVIGASGYLNTWVNNNVEGSPDAQSGTIDTSPVAGIDTAFMGLAAPSTQFVAAYAGMAARFDQFDSRRSTFIGF